MMEYFTYKKIKKHQAEKKAKEGEQTPVLKQEDEDFLQRIVSAEGTPPPLPERPVILNPEILEPGIDAQLAADKDSSAGEKPGASVERSRSKGKDKNKDKGKGKEKEKSDEKDGKKPSRWSTVYRKVTKKDDGLKPTKPVPAAEAEEEEDDINRVLDELNLAAINNSAFSISAESQELLQRFTLVLKDIVNGVPTAYDDLVKLVTDADGTLSNQYEKLPSFLKKLISGLPDKLKGNLAPELLAVAAEAQGLSAAEAGSSAAAGGLGAAAKSMFSPSNLKDLVTKPGAAVGMLKAIMNALKLRWPAFLGTNVLWSLGLFVLLFVFWYCHKRGREVRLLKEGQPGVIDSDGRIEELPDDAQIGNGSAAGPSSSEQVNGNARAIQAASVPLPGDVFASGNEPQEAKEKVRARKNEHA